MNDSVGREFKTVCTVCQERERNTYNDCDDTTHTRRGLNTSTIPIFHLLNKPDFRVFVFKNHTFFTHRKSFGFILSFTPAVLNLGYVT